jgi:ATP-binding cassette, subfamily B, bacterial
MSALLCRFYEPTRGTIRVDGVNIADLDAREWRQRVTASYQDYMRLEGLLRESVGVGDLPRIDEVTAIDRAIARAEATAVVGALRRETRRS